VKSLTIWGDVDATARIVSSFNPRTSSAGVILPLGALLCGMSLSASALAEDSIEKDQTMPTVQVKDVAEQEGGSSDGYQATSTRVGKVTQDPHNIPQAITIVTNKLMEEQQVSTLREALRNVSGLTFNAAEGGRSGDNMNLRGFYTFGDIYLDGIRDTAQYNRETFNLEQIDVLRGAAAMLFGRGQAGGVINQVSKIPKLYDFNRVNLSLGTEDYREATADFNKKLGETTALRVNLMGRHEGSWRENPVTGAEPEINRGGIGASIATGIGTNNQFTLSQYYLKTDDNPDYGVPFDNATKRPTEKFPVNYFWGIDQNFDESETSITTLTHQYRFSRQTELRTTLRRSSYDRAYWASAPSNTTPPDADGNSPKTRKTDTENLALQSDLSTRFEAAGMRHQLITGLEYLKEDSDRWGLKNLGTTTAPIYTPDDVSGPPTTYSGNNYAFYIQDTVEFVPDWSVMLGTRRDQLDAEYSSLTSPELDFGEWSWRTGLSWKPSAESHYYLSWSDSFSPTADLYQLSGGEYPPERSQVTELGAKWLFMEGDLAFRSAIYRADKEYERNTDLESTAAILTNKRRTDGIEFELAGRITPDWEVFAGMALMDAEILEVAQNRNATTGVVTSADPRLQGQRPRNTPDYTFNLWTTYKLGGGWKVGGGLETKGERLVYNPSTTNANSLFTNGQFNPNTAEAYQRWDAMLAYEQKSYTVRLNVRNIFNETYYDALYDNGGFAVPGPERAFILTTEFKF
jgi:catecholate siderophore receptor